MASEFGREVGRVANAGSEARIRGRVERLSDWIYSAAVAIGANIFPANTFIALSISHPLAVVIGGCGNGTWRVM